jgi:3-oxoacyl-[acyl-carrier protein] reductase
MDLGLEGRGCVVTGGSRGIGLDVAKRLCAAGASVLLVARDAQRLAEAAGQCTAEGGTAETLAIDITHPEAAERIVAEAGIRFGTLDVLVNNAGAAKWRPLEETADSDWQQAWELNVMAPMHLMRAAIPAMASRGWGRVVNVSSSAGKRPSAMLPEYSVAKAAELSLSRLFSDVHAGDGVLVNAVCPGVTRSEMWTEEGGLLDQSMHASGASSREDAEQANVASRPIPRMAEVGEVGSVIAFLCSERASYVSGVAWGVDGGAVQVIV